MINIVLIEVVPVFLLLKQQKREALYLKPLVNTFTQVPPYTWNLLLRDITQLNCFYTFGSACADLAPPNDGGKWG